MDLFCPGQKVVGKRYQDGWFRTFKGVPEVSEAVKDMLDLYIRKGQYQRAHLFFTVHCEFDDDYAMFLIRELKSGRWK